MQESQNATHLTPGHTHPPLTISPLPLNRCCGIAVWSLECISAQALCQSHPPQWPRLVLQMGLISNLQRQKRNAHPQHSIPGCCLETSPSASGVYSARDVVSTICSKLTVHTHATWSLGHSKHTWRDKIKHTFQGLVDFNTLTILLTCHRLTCSILERGMSVAANVTCLG